MERLQAQRSPAKAQQYADIFVSDRRRISELNALDAAGTFVLHMIPGGAFSDYATQGEWGEATIALAGDAALLLGTPLKLMAAARGLAKTAHTLHLSAVAIEGTIGGVRLGQAG